MAHQFKNGYVEVKGGVKLYYEVIGKNNRKTLACCNGLGVSTFFWKYIAAHFERGHQIILWDYRGHGRSEMPLPTDELTMKLNAQDLFSVLERINVKKAVLLGHSMGVQTILEFAHLFPEKVCGLIPILGTFGHPVDTFFDTKMSHVPYRMGQMLSYKYPHLLMAFNRWLLRQDFSWEIVKALKIVHPVLCSREDMEPYMDHLRTLDMQVFFKMCEKMQEHSAEKYLRKIKAPTLVFAGELDLFTPMWCSEKMVSDMPNAELFVIPHGSHAGIVEQPGLINAAIEKFLKDKVWPPRKRRKKARSE